jgi:hypothetical protein
MFVRGVVVTGDVGFFVGRCAPFDQVKEALPFLMPVLIHACANDAAVGCVHCCKQGGRAVTFVIVSHGLAASFLQRKARLCAIQCLDLTLLVQHGEVSCSN